MPPHNAGNPNYIYYWNNFPSYVYTFKDLPNKRLYIEIIHSGTYTILIYLKHGENDYRLYRESHYEPAYEYIRLPYPQDCTFWLVIYRVAIKDHKINYEYVGDREFPYPLYLDQN